MSSADIPKRIRAIQIFKNGGPEVIEQTEIDAPVQKPTEILVKLEWGGVNFIDTYIREGLYPTPNFPRTVGQESAGVVVALPTASEVLENPAYKKRNLKVGDKVIAVGAGFQEYAVINWDKALPIPSSVSTKLAAAGFLQGLTALTFASEAYTVKKDDWIFVSAVAGGVGTQLTQIAKKFGAKVIGTTSTAEKAQLAKEFGADHVILYTQQNVVEEVLKITDGVGVHASFDGIGKETWEDNFKIVARKGTIVTLGNTTGAVPPFAPLKLTAKNLKVIRPTMNNYIFTTDETDYYVDKYFKLIEEGLKVPISQEYPFTADGVRQSQVDLKSGKTTGKLLINIAGLN